MRIGSMLRLDYLLQEVDDCYKGEFGSGDHAIIDGPFEISVSGWFHLISLDNCEIQLSEKHVLALFDGHNLL